MRALWELLRGAAASEVGLWQDHARRRAGLLVMLAFFAFMALLFGMALLVVLLSIRLGLLAALALALGLAVLGCLVVIVALMIEARAHRRHQAEQAAARRRLAEVALLTLLPGMKGGTALLVGLAVLALTLLGGKGGGDQGSET